MILLFKQTLWKSIILKQYSEIEIDAVTSIDNDFEIQNVETVETPKEIAKEPSKDYEKEPQKDHQEEFEKEKTSDPIKV